MRADEHLPRSHLAVSLWGDSADQVEESGLQHTPAGATGAPHGGDGVTKLEKEIVWRRPESENNSVGAREIPIKPGRARAQGCSTADNLVGWMPGSG